MVEESFVNLKEPLMLVVNIDKVVDLLLNKGTEEDIIKLEYM
jgi:hypothetical protein